MVETHKDAPKYAHTDDAATFLGHYNGDDLYYKDGKITIRFGSEPKQITCMKRRYRHNAKNSIFLGYFEKEDLYYQQGQVVARFSNDPQDYLMAGTELAEDVASLEEAIKRAERLKLQMDTGELPVIVYLTTPELIALATEEKRVIDVYRVDGKRKVDHTIHALEDGSIVETGTNEQKWQTSTKEFLKKYPEDLGEIWCVEMGDYIGLNEEDDDD